MLSHIECVKAPRHYERIIDSNGICFVPGKKDTPSIVGDDFLLRCNKESDVFWLGSDPNALVVSEDGDKFGENYDDEQPSVYFPAYVISDVNDDNPESSLDFFDAYGTIEIGFLRNAVTLEREGDLRGSLGIIYRRVDEFARESMLEALDEEISSVPAEEIGTDVLLGLLTATLPVKRKLASRPQLFKATLKLMKARGHFERGILDGLE